MNVAIHRDFTRMISNLGWSDSHRLATKNDSSLNNPSMNVPGNIPGDAGLSGDQLDQKEILALIKMRQMLEIGKEFATITMKDTKRVPITIHLTHNVVD